ncbi:MAG: bifunctional phosphopantothenoylcysteine decarboxylase/phosphopantothenate--cysteine ligase CoaBC [Desulfobacteraceae bacterium]|jgi:phosphopantothenoylcysteine decarboxylase/phosphopantothenate--cysteine ligase
MTIALKHKQLVLGVCGGIAAYKSVELLRLLVKAGASIQVLMTKNAGHFVGPLTFEALSGKKVCTSLFDPHESAAVQHIQWAEDADAVIVAPATANFIGKLANGIADDPLSTFMLAVTSPVMLCPSMNTNMYASEPVQSNLHRLKEYGFSILSPEAGELACGATGPGRLPEPEYIFDRIHNLMTPKDLKHKRVLVTAGPTREAIDPVRFISNPSSGKMGYALARAAEMRGARVTLISGPTTLLPPNNVEFVSITTADQMYDAVLKHAENNDIIIKSAAVADYKPAHSAAHKVKKSQGQETLVLDRTRDILKSISRSSNHQILVGFAAETRNLDEFARMKLESKQLDLIVGNLIGSEGTGFEVDTNQVNLYFKGGSKTSLDVMPKADLAHVILDHIEKLILS